ncbi:acyl carrier protein [Actinomadura sp. 9N215]|uniref:acyl carrier protein n=1 Tax=Actinomadura sp. 9N215 TaxID=3375150 RepID=UPI003791AB6B
MPDDDKTLSEEKPISDGKPVPDDNTLTKLVTFTRETLRPEGLEAPIEADTPLLDLGVLDSLKTAILLSHIRDELGVSVPPIELTVANFRNLRNIAALVDELAIAPTR